MALQLSFTGLESDMAFARVNSDTPRELAQNMKAVTVGHQIRSGLPTIEELSFVHAGLCQAHLPRSKPEENNQVWVKTSGRFKLIIQPGLLAHAAAVEGKKWISPSDASAYCGVPYGARARLLMIWLQSEGVKGREIRMDNSMSAWMRSLGLQVTGGKNGSIGAIREQVMRIVTSTFSLQWLDTDDAGNTKRHVKNTPLVDGHALFEAAGDPSRWRSTITITQEFYDHLREHAVPLDRRAIAYLKANSLALDIYAYLAHRLHRVSSPVFLNWAMLVEQFGDQTEDKARFAQRLKETLIKVRHVYADMSVEVERHGLKLFNSPPPVPPKTSVSLALVKRLPPR